MKIVKVLVGLGILLGLAAVMVWGYREATLPQPVVLQGQLEVQATNIASKISGRVAEVFVKEGEQLVVGAPILRMDTPEVDAKVAQAKAAHDAAEAVAKKAEAGARPQEIQMAYEQMMRAKAGLDVAQKTYQRVHTLANEGLLSRQKNDEANAQYQSAMRQYETARAQYEMAKEGVRKEDIAAAQAQARQVQAVVDEAMIAEDEGTLKSPVAGEVSAVMPNAGEIIGKGIPVVVLVNLEDQRLELNVREDYLQFFALGSEFEGQVPALNGKNVRFKVYASAVLPDFATWRPTRSDEGFDMRTFLVKARPLAVIKGMRPGMSVLVPLPVDEKEMLYSKPSAEAHSQSTSTPQP